MGLGRYFIILGIIAVNLIGTLLMMFRLEQHFIAELILFGVVLLISLIVVIGTYSEKCWAWKLASLLFIFFMFNIFFMYFNATHGAIVTKGSAFLAALGFVIAVSSTGAKKKKIDFEKEVYEEIPSYIPPEIKIEPYGEEETIEEKKEIKSSVKKTVKPGKFVASKTGSVYHTAKCEWAKKVQKQNQVWFNSKDEARKAGYKMHSCLRK